VQVAFVHAWPFTKRRAATPRNMRESIVDGSVKLCALEEGFMIRKDSEARIDLLTPRHRKYTTHLSSLLKVENLPTTVGTG
jgi:hypothetical protein